MITDLIEQFRQLQAQLLELKQHLHSTQPTHWVPLSERESSYVQGLDFAADLISDLWYQDQQDGRETRSRHGLILADATSVALIDAINQTKDDFRAAVNAEKQDAPHWKQAFEQLCEQPAPLRDKLQNVGLSRIHLKQCFRHIPLLQQAPRKVGFSWYVNGRSIKKLTLKQAEDELLELGEDKAHIQIQLQKLGQLPPATVLAQMQTLAPVVRANLVFGSGDNVVRKAMNVSMPVFVPAASGRGPLPEHNLISPEPPEGRTRQARGDQRLQDEPFLPSIRGYLYR